MVEAHVDTCLAYESRRPQVEHERTIGLVRENEDVAVNCQHGLGWARERPYPSHHEREFERDRNTHSAGAPRRWIRRMTMTMTERNDAVFGGAQFGEADVLRVESDVDVDGVEKRRPTIE